MAPARGRRLATCPACGREKRLTRHHHPPRSKGGKGGHEVCDDCHRAIHARFDTAQLAAFESLDDVLRDRELARTIRFIAKQDPRTAVATKTSRRKRIRGR